MMAPAKWDGQSDLPLTSEGLPPILVSLSSALVLGSLGIDLDHVYRAVELDGGRFHEAQAAARQDLSGSQ
jgi:hypothetical protein